MNFRPLPVATLAYALLTAALAASPRVETASPPLFFTALPGSADLVLRAPALTALFAPSRVLYRFPGRELRVVYPGSRAIAPVGADPRSGRVNYLLGSDPAAWKPDTPTYGTVVYPHLWPGIDVAYSLADGCLKTEYRIEPGAAPRTVRWRIEGANSIAIQADGSLAIRAGSQVWRDAAPTVFEEDPISRQRRPISGAFRLLGHHTIGISVAPYDPRNRIIFDPLMGYSTYFGGSGQDQATGVAIDSNGDTVVAGYTTSLDLAPAAVTFGTPLRTTAFVAKFTAAGNQLVFCTYLGGRLDNRALAVAVDRWNNIYLAGATSSSDFPVHKPLQPALAGPQNAFVAELNPAGNNLVFSTFWGGSVAEQAYGIAVSRQGNIYVAGDTQSNDFPLVHPIQPFSRGNGDAFILKLGISGSSAIWSSYLGGSLPEHAAAVAVGLGGSLFLTGWTQSSDFPTASAFQPNNAGAQNAFISKINSAGTALLMSTYAGGSGYSPGLPESGNGIAVDTSGAIYVAGTTASTDFPVTQGAFQPALTGGILDAFALKIGPSGSLVYSTFLGGSSADYGSALAIDVAGNAHIAGYTASQDFPISRGVQAGLNGGYDLFITKLNASGSALIYSTLLGGGQSDSAAGIAVDRYGTVAIAGQTASPDFPVSNAFQTSLTGAQSAIVARIPVGWKPTLFGSNGVWAIDYLTNGGTDGVSPAVQLDYNFGLPGDQPVLGDWSGTGRQNIGLFRNGTWFLDIDGDGLFTSADRTFVFGQAGDVPVVGDWDGSGNIKAGLFRNGTFILDFSGKLSGVPTGKSDLTFPFGAPGDIPVVGDWNQLGTTNVGVFRSGQWLLDANGTHTINGPAHSLGQAGDLPLVGDWDGSGLTKTGVYRGNRFLLDYNGNWQLDTAGDLGLTFGTPAEYALTRY